MIAAFVLSLACAGAGALVLRAMGLWLERDALERGALAICLGFGLVGWLFFFVGISGWLAPAVVWSLCLALAAGIVLFREPAPTPSHEWRPSWIFWVLCLATLTALFFDFAEGLAPPVDADTLAYHFTNPRDFARAGRVDFIPRTFDGAIPMLVHMTYTAAHILGGGDALGGTQALTAWTFVSGWMAAILLFAFARRWLSPTWSLAIALLFQTLPAMVYGAGSGQMEARLAIFVMIAVVGLVDGHRKEGLAPVALVALGAGFYAGGKYLGLLFVIAAIAALLASGPGRARRLLFFGVVAAIAGGQWYVWNLLHTGDPVFPFLFKVVDRLGLANHAYWDADFAADFGKYQEDRGSTTRAFHWILTYPVIATFFPVDKLQSGRVGLGPYFLLIAPLAGLALWRVRDRLRENPLFPVSILLAVFYVLWIYNGIIPKVRHLVPVMPPLALALTVAATSRHSPVSTRPVALALFLSLGINLAVHALFSRDYVRFLASGQPREEFLLRSVYVYPVAAAVNALPGVRRIYVWERPLRFYIEAPTFFAAPGMQKLIDSRAGRMSPGQFLEQLRTQGISHLVLSGDGESEQPASHHAVVAALSGSGCLTLVESVPYERFNSRTLRSLSRRDTEADIWMIVPGCAPPPGKGPEAR